MRENPKLPPLSAGTIVRRTCGNTGHPGWLLCFVKDTATLSIHFSDQIHGGSAPSRAAAQRALDELRPLFQPGYQPIRRTAREQQPCSPPVP